MKIILRIIVLPFFSALALIGAIYIWLRWTFNFIKHGGEAIAYTDKINSKTIFDVYQKITDKEV